MDQHRILIAIALSFLIFLLWELFFVDRKRVEKTQPKPRQPQIVREAQERKGAEPAIIEKPQVVIPDATQPSIKPRVIFVSTPLYSVQISEKGAVFTSFVLKDYRETVEADSSLFKLVASTRFKLSENSFIQLRQDGIPDNILSKLSRLKPEGYKSKYLFERNLRQIIGEDQAAFYKSTILKRLKSENIHTGTIRTGLLANSIAGLDDAVFISNLKSDAIDINYEPEEISFSWVSPQGIRVVKTFLLSPETYMIGLRVTIENGSDQTVKDNLILSLVKPVAEKAGRYFEGPSALINDKLEQIKIKKIKDKNVYTGSLKWIAVQDRYFLSSIIQLQPVETSMQLFLRQNNIVENRIIQPASLIPPGSRQSFEYKLFLGPKSVKVLGKLGYDLEKAVNFGWFDFIAKPCVWIMNFLYGFIPNYGVAIIILTLSIKIILWPLGAKSSRSMSKMKDLQPEMKKIREKYKNDKKKMNEEVMRLYKTFGANPMSGCLLMLPQIPVFFALYRMLYESIELRHAPFFWWINDLSAPDRLFRFAFSIPLMEPPYGIPVLTVIMGATMFLQQKMQPMGMGDPAQAKMMMMMPIVFTVIFINFSSGLVLYWLVNNVLTIAQQYYVSKKKS